MKVSGIRFVHAPEHLLPTGLLGWTSFLLDDQLRISGVAVRKTRNGRLSLSFPARDDGYGQRWSFVQPIDDAVRVALERQVLAQIEERVG